MLQLFAPFVLLFALVASIAASAGVDMDLMQSIEEINDSLSSNIALEKTDASLTDAQELADLFSVVEEFYVKQPDAADAVTISRESRSHIDAVLKAVQNHDFESAANSATDLSRACRACHTFYRED